MLIKNLKENKMKTNEKINKKISNKYCVELTANIQYELITRGW